jgi:2-iminobutanoate/2-iminopropanoate deaminase
MQNHSASICAIALATLFASIVSTTAEAQTRHIIEGEGLLVMDNQAGVVVTEDGFIFTPGITGMDPATRKFVAADPAAQMRQAMLNLEAALRAAGALLEHVVQIRLHVASLEDYRAANPVYVEFFRGHRPARTVLGFTPWDPRFRLQIEAVAKLPAAPKSAPAPRVPRPPISEVPAGCSEPVVMVVLGELSERGFQRPADGSPGYGEQLRQSRLYERYEGWYLLSGRPAEVFEGRFDARRMLLAAEFPCLEAARQWYHSDDYTRIRKLRDGAGEFTIAVWPKRTIDEMHWVRDPDYWRSPAQGR